MSDGVHDDGVHDDGVHDDGVHDDGAAPAGEDKSAHGATLMPCPARVTCLVHVEGADRGVRVADLEERRAAAEVAGLFDLAAREHEALGRLDGCVALLREVQAAKAALSRLSPAQLRAGLAHRRRLISADIA